MERPAERSTLTSGTLVAGEPGPPDPIVQLERQMAARLATKERRRAAAIAVVVFVIVLAAIAGDVGTGAAQATLVGLGLLELGVARWGARVVPSVGAGYLVASAEAGLVTLVLYLAAPRFEHPVEVLLWPGAMAWTALIIASIGRLDPWISLYQGVASAAGYALLAVLFTPPDTISLSYALVGPPRHFVEVLLLLGNGVCAAFISAHLLGATQDTWRAQRDLDEATTLLGGYVSPERARRQVEEGMTGPPEIRPVTVLCFDIREFGPWAAERDPSEVVAALGKVHRAAIGAINRNEGVVYRLVGDGLTAVFFEGNDGANAVNAAYDLIEAIARLQASEAVPPLRVGVGLDRGDATLGVLMLGQRRELVVLGNVLTIASRIERFNKDYGSQILASEPVWHSAGQAHTSAPPIDDVRIRGIPGTVRLYKML